MAAREKAVKRYVVRLSGSRSVTTQTSQSSGRAANAMVAFDCLLLARHVVRNRFPKRRLSDEEQPQRAGTLVWRF